MKRALWTGLMVLCMVFSVRVQQAGSNNSEEVNVVLSGIETKYRSTTYTAVFHQTSTLKAMEITDAASGKIFIKAPGAMRWEYETPDPQTVITNGEKLWVYRPHDRQVMVGKAPVFFGEGKGAGFLSDIGQVRNSFSISRIEPGKPNAWSLKLIPNEKRPDLSEVHLTIDDPSYEISEVTTYNSYGDKTRIVFSNSAFGGALSPEIFDFKVPPGADIVQIDE